MASSATPQPPTAGGLPVPFWRSTVLWLTLHLAVALEVHLNEIWPIGLHWEKRSNGGWAVWLALLVPTLYLHIEGYPHPWHTLPQPPAASWWQAFWGNTKPQLLFALNLLVLHVAVPYPYHPVASLGVPELRLVA